MASEAKPQRKRARYSQKGSENSEKAENVAPTPYSDHFKVYQEDLDSKYDKHERLVKLSRDCTIASKRVIFLLHRISDDPDKNKIFLETESKIKDILENFRQIALELEGEDTAKFHRAYSPGVQEFIEALSYYVFLKTGKLVSVEEVQEYLTFHKKSLQTVDKQHGDEVVEGGSTEEPTVYNLPLNCIDFVLGIADLTGELMRLSVTAVSSSTPTQLFDILGFVREVYCAFSGLRPIHREIPQKLSTLRNSLMKIEQICYTIKMRGSEMPTHMLLDAVTSVDSRSYDTNQLRVCPYD